VSDESLVVGVEVGRLLGADLAHVQLAQGPVGPCFVNQGLETGGVDSEGRFAVLEHSRIAPQVQMGQRPVCVQNATVPHFFYCLKRQEFNILDMLKIDEGCNLKLFSLNL